jgi:hypothetical protein
MRSAGTRGVVHSSQQRGPRHQKKHPHRAARRLNGGRPLKPWGLGGPAGGQGVSPHRIRIPTSSHSCRLSFPLDATPEQVDNFVIERRDVVGFATRNEVSVDDHLPIDPFRAGILQIALE